MTTGHANRVQPAAGSGDGPQPPSAAGRVRPGSPLTRRWAELALGVRFAVAGGRDGWLRTGMTAVGVGLGVALLLVASAVPTMLQARDSRGEARSTFGRQVEKPGATLLVGEADTVWRDADIRGRIVQPEGLGAPVPPGLSALPAPGEMVVSPALAGLLTAPDAAALRQRLPYRVVGTIDAAGLTGPAEHAYYAGSDRLAGGALGDVQRVDGFGFRTVGEGLDAVLMLLVVIAFVTLLLPVAVFVAAAARFGGDQRDRRLAALRLLGADGGMVRRVAAGEALLSAAAGLAAGAAFFLAGRRLAEHVELWDISVYAADVRPSPALAVLVAVAVPGLSVAVTVLALRGVVIEPLGVVRRAAAGRRRLWWRLLLPAAGLALLYPMAGTVSMRTEPAREYQAAAGALLLLVGVVTLLPWLVEAVVRRLGGGPVAWQLAVRRLQLTSGTSARVVNGVAVAVAGGIALQMLFAGIEGGYREQTSQDTSRAQVAVLLTAEEGSAARSLAATLRQAPVVGAVAGGDRFDISGLRASGAGAAAEAPVYSLLVADCAALRTLAGVDRCADGDVFIARDARNGPDGSALPAPGERVELGVRTGPDDTAPRPAWRIPATARTVEATPDPIGLPNTGVLATPAAVAGVDLPSRRTQRLYLQVEAGRPDAMEQVRTAAAAVSPLAHVAVLAGTTVDRKFAGIRRALLAGVVVTLLLIGSSMLVGALEQLRERGRLLAVLVAFGTRRSTLGWSVLWQTAVPVLLGVALAVAAGCGLGAVLLAMVNSPVRFDVVSIAGMSALAAGMVLLVTALTLPVLWRLMRPEGLRTE
jgi:hypothetical protein